MVSDEYDMNETNAMLCLEKNIESMRGYQGT